MVRLFVIESFYPVYLNQFYFRRPWLKEASFLECLFSLLEDRFDATHILEPIYGQHSDVQFVVHNDKHSQQRWAYENGLKSNNMLEIMLTQIEHHNSEVVYALDPSVTKSDVLRRFPATVKNKIVWNASPAAAYCQAIDLVLSSHNEFLIEARKNGIRAAYFTPSHDPEMIPFGKNTFRPIDICFVGTYSDGHKRRNRLLQKIANWGTSYRIVFGLMHPKFRPLFNNRFLRRIPSPFHYLPRNLRATSCGPLFGRDLYSVLGKSKIAINAQGNLGQGFGGNMRCYEAMGCGACMVSDAGIYPSGMIDNETFVSFKDDDDAIAKISRLLEQPERCRLIGRNAAAMLETNYSKPAQWDHFKELVGNL